MSIVVRGIVKEGKVIPEQPLPEGVAVHITLIEEAAALPADLQEELAAWVAGSTKALEMVERLAEEGPQHENG